MTDELELDKDSLDESEEDEDDEFDEEELEVGDDDQE